MKPVIYDGDMGGDDLWAIAMLLAHRDKFNILGISTVFGNVSQPQATKNVLNFLHWLGEDNIPVVQGADMPSDGMRPFGDDAYGENGVGGVILPESPQSISEVNIADWLAAKLSSQPLPTTVFSTGPATNLALLAQKHPETLKKIEEIIFMGGALSTIGKDGQPVHENGTRRIGNITLYAEFNAYQDPKALNILLQSGVRMVFMAADATQHLVLTPERQERIKALHDTYGPALHRMLMAVEHLDRTKFGVDGPFIHDPNVVTYALQPELYTGEMAENLAFIEADPKGVFGQHRGEANLLGSFANAVWKNGIPNPAHVFDLMEESLRKTIAAAPKHPAPLAG